MAELRIQQAINRGKSPPPDRAVAAAGSVGTGPEGEAVPRPVPLAGRRGQPGDGGWGAARNEPTASCLSPVPGPAGRGAGLCGGTRRRARRGRPATRRPCSPPATMMTGPCPPAGTRAPVRASGGRAHSAPGRRRGRPADSLAFLEYALDLAPAGHTTSRPVTPQDRCTSVWPVGHTEVHPRGPAPGGSAADEARGEGEAGVTGGGWSRAASRAEGGGGLGLQTRDGGPGMAGQGRRAGVAARGGGLGCGQGGGLGGGELGG
jgi:hypothetical protein